MTSNFNLKAHSRNTLGSADSRRARKAGVIPAVIHTKDGSNLNITVDAKDFEHQYLKGNVLTTSVQIDLDGKKISAITHKVEVDPVTDRPIHVDFIPFEKNQKIKVQAKVKFVGQDKSPGIKRGGFLHVVLRRVSILCNSNSIPEAIEVDISSSRVGAKIRSESLKLPEGAEFAKKNNFIVASILGRGSKEDDDKAAAAEGGAAPAAAGAKAPAAGDKKEAAKPAAAKPAAKK